MQSQQTVSKLVNENPALKAFDKSVKEEIKSIQGNLEEILKLLKFDEERRVRAELTVPSKRLSDHCSNWFAFSRATRTFRRRTRPARPKSTRSRFR